MKSTGYFKYIHELEYLLNNFFNFCVNPADSEIHKINSISKKQISNTEQMCYSRLSLESTLKRFTGFFREKLVQSMHYNKTITG